MDGVRHFRPLPGGDDGQLRAAAGRGVARHVQPRDVRRLAEPLPAHGAVLRERAPERLRQSRLLVLPRRKEQRFAAQRRSPPRSGCIPAARPEPASRAIGASNTRTPRRPAWRGFPPGMSWPSRGCKAPRRGSRRAFPPPAPTPSRSVPYTASGWSRTSQPLQIGHTKTLVPQNASMPGSGGSSSTSPVASSSRRHCSGCASPRTDSWKRSPIFVTLVTSPSRTVTQP